MVVLLAQGRFALTAIAREVARYVEDGDYLINTSSVALDAWVIDAHDVTVVTNNGKVSCCLRTSTIFLSSLLVVIRPPRASMTGDTALECIQHITAAKCFLGCTGFREFWSYFQQLLSQQLTLQMLKRLGKHYVVADSSSWVLLPTSSLALQRILTFWLPIQAQLTSRSTSSQSCGPQGCCLRHSYLPAIRLALHPFTRTKAAFLMWPPKLDFLA